MNSLWRNELSSAITATYGEEVLKRIGDVKFVFDDHFCNRNVQLMDRAADGSRRVVIGKGYGVLTLFGIQPYFF
jgi:hypothetical protein